MQCPLIKPGRNFKKFHLCLQLLKNFICINSKQIENLTQLIHESNIYIPLTILNNLAASATLILDAL